MVTGILVVSLVVQIAAVVLALRLIPITRARAAWILIAGAIALMALRRAITLWRLAVGDEALPPDLPAEVVALAISTLMLAGIALIRDVFEAHRRAEAALRLSETTRRELEVRLLHAQKMEALGRLAGGVAHDFNNLLTAIIGCTDLALQALPSGHPQRQLLEDALAASGRAAELSRRLLAFSRKQPVLLVDVDPNEAITRVVGILRRLMPSSVSLETRLGERLGAIRADPVQLEQVLLNLAINARDAMPHGGVLSIETSRVEVEPARVPAGTTAAPGTYVAITVRDTGVGMDEATRARLFEPFFTTKEPGRGTGLGLATVYGIVGQLGGFMEVTSAPGQGSTFVALLPKSTSEPETAPVSAPSVTPTAIAGAQGAILVVDDEEMIRGLLRATLAAQGYDVVTAENGADALAIAQDPSARIDLLLTDSVMPGLSGENLARQITALRPDTKVILMSGFMPEPGSTFPFLTKPFALADLLARVRGSLTARGDAPAP